MEATGGQGVQLSLCNTWTESMLFIGNLVKVTPKVGKIVPVRGWKRGPAPPRLHTGWRRAGSESAQVFFIITLLGREAQVRRPKAPGWAEGRPVNSGEQVGMLRRGSWLATGRTEPL